VRRLMLVALVLGPAPSAAADPPWEFNARGPLVAFTRTAITVDSSTCLRTAGSPGRLGAALGETVDIFCNHGVLTSVEPINGHVIVHGSIVGGKFRVVSVDGRPVPTPTWQRGTIGRIGELSFFWITAGTMRCSVDHSAPDLRAFHLGERVLMICSSGSLLRLEPYGVR
jgi:hypothetical protein